MAREKKIVPRVINAAIFIIMEVAALAMLRSSGDLQDIWLQRSAHFVMDKAWGGSESIRNYFSLKSQNDELAEENYKLLVALNEYKEREEEGRSAIITDSIVRSSQFFYIPARINKISRNKQHNYLILNKGSEDGVRPQSGIITAKGVIGIVDAVERHYSYGISFMNTNMNVSARIGRDGAVGPLVWNGVSRKSAVLREIPLQYRYEVGDTVWTSGFSSIFPPGIPIGKAGIARIVNGAANEIEVSLFEDFSSIRYVTIVDGLYTEEIESLERLEEE